MNKSKMDIAYELILKNKKSMAFDKLWAKISKELELDSEQSDEMISPFYTDLSLDGRFITLGDNVWDLRERHSFEKVHIDMNDIYSSEEVIELEDGLIAKEDIEEELFEKDEVEAK